MLSKYAVIFRILVMSGMIAVGSAIHLPSPMQTTGQMVYLGAFVKDQPGKPIVSVVVPGSPANLAGIQPGDQILTVEGRNVESAAEWDAVIKSLKVGDSIEIVVSEGGKTIPLTARLISPPERVKTGASQPGISFYGAPWRY